MFKKDQKLTKTNSAFTLIELLVVISIIGILIAISIFGLSGVREATRDARRKSDLELIKQGIELYKADCGVYPTTLVAGTSLVGAGGGSCLATNVYISLIPDDPVEDRDYRYAKLDSGYELCASLEQATGSVSCGGSSNCGTSSTCNYKTTGI